MLRCGTQDRVVDLDLASTIGKDQIDGVLDLHGEALEGGVRVFRQKDSAPQRCH